MEISDRFLGGGKEARCKQLRDQQDFAAESYVVRRNFSYAKSVMKMVSKRQTLCEI